MNLFKTRDIKVISILMLVACIGASVFITSCKNEQKGEIDKKAVAQIGFYETYLYKDIAQDISKLCEATGDSTLLKNKINVYDERPVVCNATKSDTTAINAVIEKHGKDILPANLKLMWTQEPENGYFQLIALKTDASGKPAMTGESIIKADVTKNDLNGHETYTAIAITLDKESTKKFSRFSADNIGRPIAIIYKDKVLSYPTVQCQIDGGTVELTGNFDEEEANDFVDMLYGKK